MGINKEIFLYEQNLNIPYNSTQWCESGNQIIKVGKKKPAKEYYQSLGVKHISIDLNGKNGSLKIDLCKPVPDKLIDKFNVITNYGTSEHVNSQYAVFKNIHNMCKDGGIMIHAIPTTKHDRKHCRYFYSESFIIGLAQACKYEIRDITKLSYGLGEIFAFVYIKSSCEFISKKEFNQISGLIDTKNKKRTGNYNP